MTAYYNEFDPKAAAWLRELIRGGHIAPGDVDERSILDVTPDDLRPYTQCHFFAGIGVWSYALRRAGWPDDRPVWTGSCPCQPFSAAGKRGGIADERHLWSAWQWLIGECRPDVIFGEQVASKDGLGWLDLVHADLEGTGYAVGAVDSCAAGFGAPHIRQRLYFTGERLGDPEGDRRVGWTDDGDQGRRECPSGQGSAPGGLDDSGGQRGGRNAGTVSGAQGTGDSERRTDGRVVDGAIATSCIGGLAVSDGAGSGARKRDDQGTRYGHPASAARVDDRHEAPGPTNGFWRDADWLFCRDERWRPVEPGTFPLAHGAPVRVGRLRGYGNAIVAPQAAAFVEAFLGEELDRSLRVTFG